MNAIVEYLPAGTEVDAAMGTTLLDAALDAGVAIPHECGGNCACTTCRVIVLTGAEWLSPVEAPEDDRLATAPDRAAASRLACQALIRGGPLVVRIVEEMLEEAR